MLILQILKERTDKEHRLRQDDIIRLLEVNYDMKCDRRSVKNNILSLLQFGYQIPLKGGYCLLEREFTNDELKTLIDGVEFLKSISKTQKLRLLEKIIKMGNMYFKPKIKYIAGIEKIKNDDKSKIRENIAMIDGAIEQRRQIKFIECQYDKNFIPCPKTNETTVVNPYQIFAANENYYLVGNKENTQNISYFRIDLIKDLEVLTSQAKSKMEIKKYQLPKNLAESLSLHFILKDSEETEIKLQVSKSKLDIILDWFGEKFEAIEETEENIIVLINGKEEAIERFALYYGDSVEILEPQSLREKIWARAEKMLKKYKN